MNRAFPIIRRRAAVPPANFSRDTGRLVSVLAVSMSIASLAAAATTLLLLQAAHEQAALAETSELQVSRLQTDAGRARASAVDAPSRAVFDSLKDDIVALNALDYGAAPTVGGLLDTLEATLPDNALLLTMDYDRNKGTADLVATSANSEQLTHLFDLLDEHGMFAKVRLLDKKQVAAAGTTHTQVHLLLDALSRPAPARQGSRP
jgi:hypothetical protein